MITHPPPPAASDEELAARRDVAALYERYAGRLLPFLSGRGVPAADLEDLHQEVWVRVARGLSERPFTGQFGAWVFQIARNLAVDRARRGGRGRPLPPDDELRCGGTDPAQEAARRELVEHLERCLRHLEPRALAVVRARSAGLGYDAVCADLGIERRAAYKIFHEATARLADCLRRAGL